MRLAGKHGIACVDYVVQIANRLLADFRVGVAADDGGVVELRIRRVVPLRIERRAALQQRRVLLKCNAPASALAEVVAALPALHAPTVNKLNDSEWFAVESVVEERKVRELIPVLTRAGATGIIELALNKIIY